MLHKTKTYKFNSFIVSFNIQKFLHDIAKSYKNKFAIFEQFTKDFPRCEIFIDNTKVNSIDYLFYVLSANNKKINIYGMDITYMFLILLLCCQSSFFISFYYLHNKMHNEEDIAVLDNSNYPKKIFLSSTDIYSIKLETGYKLFNKENDTILAYIKTETSFNLENKHGILNYNNFNNLC